MPEQAGYASQQAQAQVPPQQPLPPQGQIPPQGQGQPQHSGPQKPLSSLAGTGLVFAIIAIVLSWVPLINNLAFMLGIVGLILAVFALHATGKKGKKRGHGMALTTLIVSILSLVLVLGTQSIYSSAIDKAVSDTSTSSSASSPTKKDSSKANKQETKKNTNAVQDMEGDVGGKNYHVKIDSLVKSVNDVEGKPTVLLTYELTNNKNENSVPAETTPQVFQNGHQLNTAVYFDPVPEGYDANSYLSAIQPGATGTVTLGYVLEDESNPVTVEISGDYGLSHQKVTHEFAIQ